MPIGSRIASAFRNRRPQREFGGPVDFEREQAGLEEARGFASDVRRDPAAAGLQFAEALQPQFQSFANLITPQFRRDLGSALGGTFARSGRSGALTSAARRVSEGFADRLGEHRNLLLGQALGLGVQHGANVLGDVREGERNLLGLRDFGFRRDAFQEELRLAQQAARQKRKGGFLGAVGGLLGGVGGAFLGPFGAAAGSNLGSKLFSGGGS